MNIHRFKTAESSLQWMPKPDQGFQLLSAYPCYQYFIYYGEDFIGAVHKMINKHWYSYQSEQEYTSLLKACQGLLLHRGATT